MTPREIILHKKSRTLEVLFESGERFIFPCAYLRAFSPSAETRHHPVSGKENVNILAIEPVGNYAIKPLFSDGHQTGIFSWKTLYELGVNQKKNWPELF
jgi:DUF971 family protein